MNTPKKQNIEQISYKDPRSHSLPQVGQQKFQSGRTTPMKQQPNQQISDRKPSINQQQNFPIINTIQSPNQARKAGSVISSIPSQAQNYKLLSKMQGQGFDNVSITSSNINAAEKSILSYRMKNIQGELNELNQSKGYVSNSRSKTEVDLPNLVYCEIHDSKIKYYCIDEDCEEERRESCAECMFDGAHKGHDYAKYVDFMDKVIRSTERVLMYIQATRNDNQETMVQKTQKCNKKGGLSVLMPNCLKILKLIYLLKSYIKLDVKKIKQNFNHCLEQAETMILQRCNDFKPTRQYQQEFEDLDKRMRRIRAHPLQQESMKSTLQLYRSQEDIPIHIGKIYEYQYTKQEKKQELIRAEEKLEESLKILDTEFKKVIEDVIKPFSKLEFFSDIRTEYWQEQFQGNNTEILQMSNQRDPSDVKSVVSTQSKKDSYVSAQKIGYTHVQQLNKEHFISLDEGNSLKFWKVSESEIDLVKEVENVYDEGFKVSSVLIYDPRLIFTGGSSGEIRIWETHNVTIKSRFIAHEGLVSAIEKIKDYKIASTSYDRCIKIWNLSRNFQIATIQATLTGHVHQINCMKVDGQNEILTGSYDKTIKLWQHHKLPYLQKTFEGHTGWIPCIILLNDTEIISGSGDKTIKVWDKEKQPPLVHTLVGHQNTVQVQEFQKNYQFSSICLEKLTDTMFVSGSIDKTIRMWVCNTINQIANEYRVFEGHDGYIRSLSVLNDKIILSASQDQTIRIWE